LYFTQNQYGLLPVLEGNASTGWLFERGEIG